MFFDPSELYKKLTMKIKKEIRNNIDNYLEGQTIPTLTDLDFARDCIGERFFKDLESLDKATEDLHDTLFMFNNGLINGFQIIEKMKYYFYKAFYWGLSTTIELDSKYNQIFGTEKMTKILNSFRHDHDFISEWICDNLRLLNYE